MNRITDSARTSPSLLERARANDAEAWGRLVQLYAPLVYHWCRRWQVPEADLADVFQEVFHAAAANLSRFEVRSEGGTFRGWLRTITYSKVCDLYRRRDREPPGQGGTEIQRRMSEVPFQAQIRVDASEEETAFNSVLRRALMQVQEHFRDNTWSAFWATVVDGRPTADVANELGMSPVGVRVARSRVLQRLRHELGDILE